MASLPSPPFVSVEGIHNFRSLGGYPTSIPTFATTRSDLLFRSAEPSQVTAAGIAALKSRNIRTIFDLRSLPEIERNKPLTPIIEIEGIKRIFVPVFKDRDYSPEAIALRYKDYTSDDGTEGFRRAYGDILESGAGSYRTILLHIRDKPHEPCLVHCTAGKDRTGIIVALILQLVGVEDQVIAEEYALTELGLAAWKDIIIKHLIKDLGGEGREGAERMVGAKVVNMLASLEMIKSKYGGAEGYLKQKCGFTDHDIQKIRANVTESRFTISLDES
ncbi:hypothetical protein MMC22_010346 [Lobaria immixta]|nr:hypothetical protein [Lobaria immixta]